MYSHTKRLSFFHSGVQRVLLPAGKGGVVGENQFAIHTHDLAMEGVEAGVTPSDPLLVEADLPQVVAAVLVMAGGGKA